MERFLIIMLAIFGLAAGEFLNDGKCSEITPQPNFNGKQFLGRWYQHSTYPAKSTGHACTKFDLSVSNGALVIVRDSYSSVTRKTVHSTAQAKVIGSGYWDVHFPQAEGSGKFKLLATDYDKYAVVYACQDVEGNKKIEDLKIITRAKFVSQSVLNQAIDIIKQNNLSTEYLLETKHTGCDDEQ